MVETMHFHAADLWKVPLCMCVNTLGPRVNVHLGIRNGWKCTRACVQSIVACSSMCIWVYASPGQRLHLRIYVHGGRRQGVWLFICISHFYLFWYLLPLHPHVPAPGKCIFPFKSYGSGKRTQDLSSQRPGMQPHLCY